MSPSSPAPDDPRSAEVPLIQADAIGVDASWGRIYGPSSVTVRRGGVTVIRGAGGRGRTALLLTLAGRMKPTTGTITAFGRKDDATHLFANATIANIDEVDGIGQTIRVHDVVTEQLRWRAPWYRWVPQSTEEDLERICRPVFGDFTIPSLQTMVEELPELTRSLLRIALANIDRPPLLVVGGVDELASVPAAHNLLERLVVLGRDQTVITADINAVRSDAGVHDVVDVENLTDQEFDVLEQEALR